MKATHIQWDVDCKEDLKRLPKEIEIPDEIIEDLEDRDDIIDAVSDYISDETGFCHRGFRLEGYDD